MRLLLVPLITAVTTVPAKQAKVPQLNNSKVQVQSTQAPTAVQPTPATPSQSPVQEVQPQPQPVQPPVAIPKPVPVKPVATVNGSLVDWMTQAGIASSDFGYVSYIVGHESGGRVTAQNPSGAYGLCQSLPASKMASAGADWQTNPITQLRWCNSYAIGRYGSWYGAYSFWTSNHYW